MVERSPIGEIVVDVTVTSGGGVMSNGKVIVRGSIRRIVWRGVCRLRRGRDHSRALEESSEAEAEASSACPMREARAARSGWRGTMERDDGRVEN